MSTVINLCASHSHFANLEAIKAYPRAFIVYGSVSNGEGAFTRLKCRSALSETSALLSAWGDEKIQEALTGCHRNKTIYKTISWRMQEFGWERSWHKCRTKMKNLVGRYRKVLWERAFVGKVKDINCKSGGAATCPFYDELDSVRARGLLPIRWSRLKAWRWPAGLNLQTL